MDKNIIALDYKIPTFDNATYLSESYQLWSLDKDHIDNSLNAWVKNFPEPAKLLINTT